MREARERLFKSLVLWGMTAALAWQGVLLGSVLVARAGQPEPIESMTVQVNGNVERPGAYRVPVGTTNFEILKVAGVLTTSDITPFNLAAQVEADQDISVGTLDKPVSVKPNIRLEFFFGEVNLISSDGRDRLTREGMSIDEGDRVLTEEACQAEISLDAYSRIDMDNFAEIVFDKIGVDEAGKPSISTFQRTGVCWYKIVLADEKCQFRTITPLANVTAAGKGADFTVDVKYSEIIINAVGGLLLVERPDGTDAINLIGGQSVTIFSDVRPLQVSKMAEDANVTQRFSQLTRAKADMIMRHMPLNIMFYGLPNTFCVFSVQFEKSSVHVVQLPAETSVDFFVQGFSTLQEAFLYGGPVFTSTLVERMLNTRVSKHVVFDKNDIVRTAASIGGIAVNLDDRASSSLRMGPGRQVLKGQKIIDFLKPGLSGMGDSRERQIVVMKEIFDRLRSKNVIITALLADQILSNIETNITVAETMKHYGNFTSRANWTFKSHSLPVRSTKKAAKIVYEPVLEECRTLITK